MFAKPATCQGCVLERGSNGFMPLPTYPSSAKVLLVGEALGEAEAKTGRPFQGAAGAVLSSLIVEGGMAMAHFAIDNALRCQPTLDGWNVIHKRWADDALAQCATHLDHTIDTHRPEVIVALGATAANRLLGVPYGTWTMDRLRGYFERSTRYQAWIGATYHPAFLMRGKWNLTPVFRQDLRRALQIAEGGYVPTFPDVIQDPAPEVFARWAAEVIRRQIPFDLDIETPHADAEAEDARDLNTQDTILRIGFMAEGQTAISIPYSAEYLAMVRQLLDLPGPVYIWNRNFDQRRLADAGMPIRGEVRDAMVMWHVLHSDLPKRLQFVAPLLCPEIPRWKHLSDAEPAFYNGVDAYVLHQARVSIERQLKSVPALWDYTTQNIFALDVFFDEMSARGMPISESRRQEAAAYFAGKLAALQARMDAVLPNALVQYLPSARGYVRDPVDTTGLVQIVVEDTVNVCGNCGLIGATKGHTTPKTLSAPSGAEIPPGRKTPLRPANPCYQAKIRSERRTLTRWARIDPFTPSNLRMNAYASWCGHGVIVDRKKQKSRDTDDDPSGTFAEEALHQLILRYPQDPLYPLVLEYRGIEKLAGYVGTYDPLINRWTGGFPVHADGRVHYVINNNPSTLRLASQEPNVNQQPRPDDEDKAMVRRCYVAEPNHRIVELDFSGIEAVLVGYKAKSARYVRLCLLGIHDFVNIHNLHRNGQWEQLPDLAWSDDDLKALFKEAKARFPLERHAAKKTVHCLTGDHEVLTPQGWVRFDALPDGVPVAQWDTDHQLSWAIPSEVIRAPYQGPLVALDGASVSLRMTPNHKLWVQSNPDNPWKAYRADELPDTGRLPQVGHLHGTEPWSDWLALALAIQADGHIAPSGGELRFNFRRLRKVRRLLKLLRRLGVAYTARQLSDRIVIRTRARHVTQALSWLGPGKTFDAPRFLSLTLEAKRHVLAEVLHWDGGTYHHAGTNRQRTEYRTMSQHNAELLHTLAYVSGKQSRLTCGQGVYRVSQNRRTGAALEALTRTHTPSVDVNVYCVTVPTGAFLVRRNMKVCVVQNSGNYLITPKGLYLREPHTYRDERHSGQMLGLYFDLFPELLAWQDETVRLAGKQKFLATPFGNRHYFSRATKWVKRTDWEEVYGEDAERAVAFWPQSTAAGILRQALRILRQDFPEAASSVRLPNHDAIILQEPLTVDGVHARIVYDVMTKPIPQLELPWQPGAFLRIPVEGKVGAEDWAVMADWKP